jgi:translation initiation factor 1
VLQPKGQTAIIRREKRRKGKVVTTITGLDPVASDLPAILKQLKTACGSGGTIAEDDRAGTVIELQGDHREKVAELLEQMNYKIKTAGG